MVFDNRYSILLIKNDRYYRYNDNLSMCDIVNVK